MNSAGSKWVIKYKKHHNSSNSLGNTPFLAILTILTPILEAECQNFGHPMYENVLKSYKWTLQGRKWVVGHKKHHSSSNSLGNTPFLAILTILATLLDPILAKFLTIRVWMLFKLVQINFPCYKIMIEAKTVRTNNYYVVMQRCMLLYLTEEDTPILTVWGPILDPWGIRLPFEISVKFLRDSSIDRSKVNLWCGHF